MAEMKAGRFKGRGLKGSAQYGESEGGNLQIAVDLNVPELGRTVTCFLSFTQAAYPYSVDRLRAMGWQGHDIMDLDGIDANEVDLDIFEDVYQGKKNWKVEIVSGPGKVAMKKAVDKSEFARRLAAITGGASAAPATSGPGGKADPNKPPF